MCSYKWITRHIMHEFHEIHRTVLTLSGCSMLEKRKNSPYWPRVLVFDIISVVTAHGAGFDLSQGLKTTLNTASHAPALHFIRSLRLSVQLLLSSQQQNCPVLFVWALYMLSMSVKVTSKVHSQVDTWEKIQAYSIFH